MRKIVKIDEDKCNGCGLCVPGCVEGAIQIIDGKARLASENFCDGLGACLGECPRDAISIEERPADAFDEEAVKQHLAKQAPASPADQGCPSASPRVLNSPNAPVGGCPGSALRSLTPHAEPTANACVDAGPPPSQLAHWPVQLELVPPHAPFLAGADLVICADCAPFAIPDFHDRYLTQRAIVIGCPKLDDVKAQREKIREIIKQAKPRRLTVVRMEVPCCGGLASIVTQARGEIAPQTPLEVHVVGIGGGIEKHVVG